MYPSPLPGADPGHHGCCVCCAIQLRHHTEREWRTCMVRGTEGQITRETDSVKSRHLSSTLLGTSHIKICIVIAFLPLPTTFLPIHPTLHPTNFVYLHADRISSHILPLPSTPSLSIHALHDDSTKSSVYFRWPECFPSYLLLLHCL